MNKPTHHRTISELTDRGWKIIYNDSTGEAVSIRSVIRHWNKLTWAQQAYYRGKYGFSERGVLDIGISGHSTTPANSGLFFRNPEPAAIAIPEECLPGSNKRLWTILEQSRVGVECNRYDDTALLHTGPDNSVILTNAAGWGPPRTEPHGYAELDDKYTCHWEVSLATWCPDAPWWAGPEMERQGRFAIISTGPTLYQR